jgi:hypothetical protein
MVATVAGLNRRLAGINRQQRVIWQRLEEQAAPTKPTRGPLELAAELGIALDPWQTEALTTRRHHVLLLVTRQGGKGTVASLLTMDQLLNQPGSKTLVVSRTENQAKRLLARVKSLYLSLPNVPKAITDRADEIGLINGSRAIAVPGSEQSIRGIDAVDLLVIDEASLVPDELYGAIRPMLATTDGRQVALSTPRGKRGWFYRAYASESPEWHRVTVTAAQIARIKPSFLERERRDLGEWLYRQEYGVEFLDSDDQLYPTDLVLAALSPAVASFGLPTLGGDAWTAV